MHSNHMQIHMKVTILVSATVDRTAVLRLPKIIHMQSHFYSHDLGYQETTTQCFQKLISLLSVCLFPVRNMYLAPV